MATLTPEQIQALVSFAKANGRNWKRTLRDAWSAGGYDATTGRYIEGSLQNLRNTLVPSWLANFSLKRMGGYR